MSVEDAGANDGARGDEQEIEAEQESAEAMDAETDYGDGVAEPPGAAQTTEGQPS
ncbi:MAG: hypothetical protein M3268_03410 [Acidobacteriota bacterium]|nr:hypothetical protein [Acidobacteriota bacterium]